MTICIFYGIITVRIHVLNGVLYFFKAKEKKMINRKLWLGMLVMVLVFGMSVVGCDDDSDDDSTQTVKYEGIDAAGNTYVLTVTKNANRAVYIPEAGDSYTLTITLADGTKKTSTGTVKEIATDGTFTLQPSVEGSDVFSVVINDEGISSVVGTVTVEDGESITPRTFDTIFLRAYRWTAVDGITTGENWGSGPSIYLSDFFDGTFIKSVPLKLQIKGTIDTELIQLMSELHYYRDGKFGGYLGNGTGGQVDLGNFEKTISVNLSNDIDQDKKHEIIVQLTNELWGIYLPTGVYYTNNNVTIPEDIPNGTIMATIRNFSIEVTDDLD